MAISLLNPKAEVARAAQALAVNISAAKGNPRRDEVESRPQRDNENVSCQRTHDIDIHVLTPKLTGAHPQSVSLGGKKCKLALVRRV
jgi:hypothetical protein